METWLITGGLGFIGSHFIRHLLGQKPDLHVINLDKITYAANHENLSDLAEHPHYEFHQGDIAEPKDVRPLIERVDLIVNFAAETHVDRSIGDPPSFIRTDMLGVHVLLEAARESSIRRFVQVSTDEVYGEAEQKPSTEEDPLMPKSPYAASKTGGDRLAFAYFATYGTPVVITRCSNNYGPFQYPEKMIPLFITNAMEDKPLPVYGDGLNSRDWVHVEDHCRALELLAQAPGIEGEIFNIGTGEERTILEMARVILKTLEKPEDLIQSVTDRPGHVRRHAVAAKKLQRRLGWSPSVTLEEGLPKTVRWYVENPGWWRPIRDGEFRAYYERMYANR